MGSEDSQAPRFTHPYSTRSLAECQWDLLVASVSISSSLASPLVHIIQAGMCNREGVY